MATPLGASPAGSARCWRSTGTTVRGPVRAPDPGRSYQLTASTVPILRARRRAAWPCAAWPRVAAPGSRAGYAARMLGAITRRSLFLAAAGLLVAACVGSSPPPSFDPATPCGGVDRQEMKGAYPDLEALIPIQVDGQAADSRD